MTTADVVIVGGGIVGASTAHYLARKGLKGVTLLEREAIASGATGRTGGLVRMHYTNRAETQMALWSRGVFQHCHGGRCHFRRLAAPAADSRAWAW